MIDWFFKILGAALVAFGLFLVVTLIGGCAESIRGAHLAIECATHSERCN